ncbi:hypothetical protein Trydic_g19108 [Trypoxylus dichotomus]
MLFLGVFKVYILLKNRQLIYKTLDILQEGVFAPNTQRGGQLEVTMVKDCIRYTHRQVFTYYTLGVLTVLNGYTMALTSKLRESDYHLWEVPWVPFGLFEVSTTFRYYVVYVYQATGITCFGFIIMTNDLLIVGVFTHVRTQFNILANFLRNIVPEHMLGLKASGISLGDNESKLYRAYQLFAFCAFASVVLEEICMLTLYRRGIDITEVATLIYMYLTHSVGLIKFFVMLKNRVSVAASLKSLHEGTFAPNFERGGAFEAETVKKAIETTRLQLVAYYILATITIFNGSITALVSKLTKKDPENWDLPWLPFAIFEVSTTFRFYVVYIWQTISLTLFCYAIVTCDLLIVGAFAHIRAQFYILGNFIRNMVPHDSESQQQWFSDYFWIHKLILKATGISLGKNDSKLYRAYQIFVFSLFASDIVEQICMVTLYRRVIDITEIATLIYMLSTLTLGIIKFFVLLNNRTSVTASLASLHEGIFAPNFERGGAFEAETVKKAVATTRLQLAIYYIWSTATIFNGYIRALVLKLTKKDPENWDVPWIPFALFEISTSFRFYVVYVWEILSLTLFCYAIVTSDLLIVGAFAHIAAQFYILGNFIRNMVPHDLAIDASKIPKSVLSAKMKYAIVYHHALIELVEKFEDLFNVLILIEVSGNTLVICFGMYMSTVKIDINSRTTREITFTFAILTQVYFYCYYGNEITLAAESVAAACYDVNFVGTDLSFQKSLLLIICRSQRPMALTIGKFATLNIGTFISIMRASYSYYMVISKNK